MPSDNLGQGQLMALDIGDKRVGVATASGQAFIASPLVTLANDDSLVSKLEDLIKEHQIRVLVIGLPRGLNGQDTDQTESVKLFAKKLAALKVDIVFQDEALSSVRAEEELARRGKILPKAEVDKLAAALILEDYLNNHR